MYPCIEIGCAVLLVQSTDLLFSKMNKTYEKKCVALLPPPPVPAPASWQPPVLEQWEEIVEGDGMGSFRGNVFGQKGLADGTAMTSAPVDVAGRRIQDQVGKHHHHGLVTGQENAGSRRETRRGAQ